MWGGEVGQDLWEMIYLIQKGGNYGWSVREGAHPFRPERPKGPGELQQPIVEHPHSDFRSITGGWVYRGKRLPELTGAYIYGDYDTGKVWMLRYDDKAKKVTEHRELCDTQVRIVEIITDADGEILFLDFAGGGLHRLMPQPPPKSDAPQFPRKLSETGLFANVKNMKPAAGVIPYDVVAPLWSDGAIKERLMAVPGDAKIEFDAVTYPLEAPVSGAGYYYGDYTTDRFTISSRLVTAESAELKAAGIKASFPPTTLIESFEGELNTDWFTYKPNHWGRSTHRVNDPQWKAPAGASLGLGVQTTDLLNLEISFGSHQAVKAIPAGAEWQEIVLKSEDFKNKKGEARASPSESVCRITSRPQPWILFL